MAVDNSKAMYLFHEYAAADCAVTGITSSSMIVLQPIHINHPSLALTKAFYRKDKMIRMRPWYLRTKAQHPVYPIYDSTPKRYQSRYAFPQNPSRDFLCLRSSKVKRAANAVVSSPVVPVRVASVARIRRGGYIHKPSSARSSLSTDSSPPPPASNSPPPPPHPPPPSSH